MSVPFSEQRLQPDQPFLVTPAGQASEQGKASHFHPEGQFAVVADGLLVLETDGQRWMMSAGRVGWIPPGVVHAATPFGPTAGWTTYLPPELCGRLPVEPTIMMMTPLTRALFARMASWPSGQPYSEAQSRIVAVLLDELVGAECDAWRLPAPTDPRLMAMAAAVAKAPQADHDVAACADRTGLSERTFTRRFREETGLSFVQWRSMARMKRALEMLAEGAAVTDTALDLGYDSVSSFITVFKRTFNVTPSRYKSMNTHDH